MYMHTYTCKFAHVHIHIHMYYVSIYLHKCIMVYIYIYVHKYYEPTGTDEEPFQQEVRRQNFGGFGQARFSRPQSPKEPKALGPQKASSLDS